VVAIEKRLNSPLIIPSSIKKIFEIDSHVFCAVSGLSADASTLVDHARSETQNHRFLYNEPRRIEALTQSICDLSLRFGESSGADKPIMSRPFGVALLIAGHDDTGFRLFHADPSGTFTEYFAKAIGSGSVMAEKTLSESYKQDLNLEEATIVALKVLKQVMEEKLEPRNIQVATVDISGYKLLTDEEILRFTTSLD
jgi:20S proteasome subunit alpha 5